jgi:hypothetical protein
MGEVMAVFHEGKIVTRRVGTRFRIQDEVVVMELYHIDPLDWDGGKSWAVGQRGLLRQVHFDLLGPRFFVEVCDDHGMCRIVECRRIRKV